MTAREWLRATVRAAAFTTIVLGFSVVAGGCGGGDASGPGNETPSPLAPFVGTWDATEFIHTAKADASLRIDIVAEGTQFVLVIQASGSYSATATLANLSQTETGTLRLVGSELILTPISPPGPESPVRFALSGSSMTWDGESEWDFASDGIPEPTFLHIVFSRR